jgi:hypothetical protein
MLNLQPSRQKFNILPDKQGSDYQFEAVKLHQIILLHKIKKQLKNS